MADYIQTGDGIFRKETAADRMAKTIHEVEQDRKASGRTERLNWKLLLGLKNTLYD